MNKCLIITGASRGIGKSIAEKFSKKNWHIINIARHHCDIPNAHNIITDFSNPDWENLNKQEIVSLLSNYKKICLVHNAAISFHDNITTLAIKNLALTFQVNLYSALILNQICLPFMEAGSSIIYIGSTLSEKAVPNSASYIISKHATAGAMKATCQDLAENPHVHTCCICPGFTETEMLKSIFKDESGYNALKKRVSANRLIKPEEIASLAFFCANNPVINGSVIHGNLGQIES